LNYMSVSIRTSLPSRPLSPRGCLTLYSEDALMKREIESIFLEQTAQWGYREVVTPIFEYTDVISPAVGEDLLQRGYKLTDRQSGRVMVIRPDVTPQIGRISATSFRDRRPLRLSYCTNIFRYEETAGGSQKEIFQAGAELIGISEPEGDAEVIALLMEVLGRLGIKDLLVSLSHRDFLDGIIEENSSQELKNDLKNIFLRKELHRLEDMNRHGTLSERELAIYSRLMFLYGGEEVLDLAEEISRGPLTRKAVENLRAITEYIYEYGLKEKIRIDLSEARGFDYHTGMLFEVLHPDCGESLGSGGRYDSMIGHFGDDSPATGFSLNLNVLMKLARKKSKQITTILVSDGSGDKKFALRTARKLRMAGFSAIREIIKRDFRATLAYAESEGISYTLRIERSGSRKALSLYPGEKEKATRKQTALIRDALKPQTIKIMHPEDQGL